MVARVQLSNQEFRAGENLSPDFYFSSHKILIFGIMGKKLFRQPKPSSFLFLAITGFVLTLCSCHSRRQACPKFKVTVCTPASRGYYFLCAIPKPLGPSTFAPVNMILDSAGKVVYYKVFERGANVGDFELQPNGLMSYSYRDTFYLMDSTFNIIDSVFCQNSIYNDRHDFKILPNGHFLLLGYEYKIMDLTPFQLKDSSGHKWGENSKVKCGVF